MVTIERPRVIAVGGFSSDTGKTSLMCDLLRAFPNWEAIKTTRGHYRSCGKDPHACCVSHLLRDEPVLLSGRSQTYEVGKDTGRYWEANAANVHWLIATNEQIGIGIQKALSQVSAKGVLIEGNSFTEHVAVDAMIMTVRESNPQIKRSAKRALEKHVTALYVWRDLNPNRDPFETVLSMTGQDEQLRARISNIPFYTNDSLSDLLLSLQGLKQPVAA